MHLKRKIPEKRNRYQDVVRRTDTCEMCVDKLNNIESARIAIDPFSGNQVDKSEAFIVVTNTQGAVAYFESEANYSAFKKN